ncbi:SDR family NAD(P)-dependent oxidoreductase [Pullulanibacillus camelliae]|uniref:SDR family NAD(P)-dependent oxidoreductase n=1 Tax=Pullulanibacillus camelliae TaxID=1707096 RepID=UPI001E380A20|nr:SDR family NAD(P)-dependent oxidoreductase [Pullulanibacillus camelliae]
MIVTGASRGLGAAIAEQFMDRGFAVITVARRENEPLKQKAQKLKLSYAHLTCDLSQFDGQQDLTRQLKPTLDKMGDLEALYVVNNAGVVEPVERVGKMSPLEMKRLIDINVLAPMVLTNHLVQLFPTTPLMIVNVTSGAAQHARHGWSAYSSSKAALNVFTETAALESKATGAPHTFIAYNPGIMDTDMQGVIRSSDSQAFQDVERFQEFKEKGMLRSPERVARALVSLVLDNRDIKNGQIYDVNDLLKGNA